jgi:hypothetical protein
MSQTYDKPFTIIRYRRYIDGSAQRFDRNEWHSQFDPEVFGRVESWVAAGTADTSGHFNALDHYDRRCSCCWLGFGHTLDYHNLRVMENASVRIWSWPLCAEDQAREERS